MLKKYSAFVLCLLISILVVTLYLNDFSPLTQLEWKVQDMMYSFRGAENYSSEIILVNIDNHSLDKYGEWPWHRDKLADLLAAIGSAEPRTILLNMPFDRNLFEDTSGHTEILAGQMSWVKNVILSYEFSPAEFMTQKVATPKYLTKSAITVNNDIGILDEKMSQLAQKVFLPPEPLCEFAAGMGFRKEHFDSDRKIRWEPLVMYFDGYYYPSVALMTAANFHSIDPSLIKVHGGDKIEMGRFEIPTNEHGELFINYNKPGSSFPEVSAADILSETFSISNLTGKLVIISATADNIMQFFQTPVSGKLRAVEKTANVIENIINSNYIKRLDSSPGRDVLILFALGSIFAFILPRVTLMYRLIIMFGSLFVLANINFVMFNSYNIMGRPLYLGLEIFLLFVACPFLDNELLAKLSTLRIGFAPPEESNRLPKAELPDENELPPVRRIKASPEENAATIEMRSPSAQKQLEKTTATDSSPVDAKQAATRMDTPVDGTEATSQMQTPPPPPREEKESISQSQTEFKSEDSAEFGLDNQAIKKLGRYEVVGKLGKGAMGMVYKGIDPAINRNVALKTIRLDFVNDPAELKELKERLTTEARAAGKLSHPNIVTIYDVGIEGTLQYIAMEYLEGQTLEDMIRHKTKFNFRIIAQMISQICSALEYAHNQAIVHRDIKPANLMVLKDLNIKVMDFGIARVDTSSMTRTGVAMGTPNYISPELLQGKPVDRRCDIFSLGVVIYELLLNRRPFKGENLTSLIYSIVNSDPEPPSKIDSSLPHVFDRVIAKALAKNPDERYQTAGEVAASLSDFIESFSAGRAKTM